MHHLSQYRTVILLIAIFSLTGLVSFGGISSAQASDETDISIGLGGVAKLGHWVPVYFNTEDPSVAGAANSYRITVLDGDDTPVTTTGSLTNQAGQLQGIMQLGRTYGEAHFEVLDREGNVLYESNFGILAKNNRAMELIPSTGRLLVCVEPSDLSDAAALSSMFDATFAGETGSDNRVVSIHSLDQLPSLAIGLNSCESLILLANDASWFNRAPDASIAAIERWVLDGGHLVLAASPEQAALFQDGGKLRRFAPGAVAGTIDIGSSRRIEEFCKSKEPFLGRGETMPLLDLQEIDGSQTLQQGKSSLVVRKPLGLGEITFIAFDPTTPRFQKWSASRRFMQNLLELRKGSEGAQSGDARAAGSAVRHSGYDDLAGQLKVPLERFTKLSFIPFELIAALIVLYILCIGVGDWFLVGRLFKKHELTWITFPLLAAVFCGIAWFAANASRPSKIQLNQVEVVDIDSTSGHVRGTSWANLYSPRGKNVDLGIGPTSFAAEQNLKMESSRLTWLGLPGDGLGGMLNRANPGLYRTDYAQPVVVSETNSADVDINMQGVELQVSSTRPLFAQWNGTYVNQVNSRLVLVDRLEGTFTNPLDVPLKNCKLFYDDLVYVVRGTLDAGDTVDVLSDTTEKTIRSMLTRKSRRVDDVNKSQSVVWDSRDRNVSRIMEMMMFYHGCGGESYTGLSNSYHDFIEMTPNISMNRAVLVGQVKNRVSNIEIDGESAEDNYDSALTIVRILLPVERKEIKRRR